MNLKSEDDDAAKKREYMREYMRARRAQAKLDTINGRATSQVAANKKVTRKKTRQILDADVSDDLMPLVDLDKLGLGIGIKALLLANQAIGSLASQVAEGLSLSMLDIKRLTDVGSKLRREFGSALATEESEEEQLIMTDDVLGNDQAIDAVNQLLRATALAELQAPNEAERQKVSVELSGGVCESSESRDMDPL